MSQRRHTQPLFPPSPPNLDSTNGHAKFTHGQDLACSSLREQLSPSPSILFGETSPIKRFVLMHPENMLSLSLSCSAAQHHLNSFYRLRLERLLSHTRFSTLQADHRFPFATTFPLTARHYCWGAKGLA